MANMLQATATKSDQALLLSYQVTNTTGQTLWLFNALPDPDRTRHACTRQVAYANAHASNVVYFLQGWCPKPRHVPGEPWFALTQLVRPWATRLWPEQIVKETIAVPLPIREWDAYTDPPNDSIACRWLEVERVELLLDCLRDADRFKEAEEFAAWPGTWRVNGHPLERLRLPIELPTPCSVQVRLDSYEGFSSQDA